MPCSDSHQQVEFVQAGLLSAGKGTAHFRIWFGEILWEEPGTRLRRAVLHCAHWPIHKFKACSHRMRRQHIKQPQSESRLLDSCQRDLAGQEAVINQVFVRDCFLQQAATDCPLAYRLILFPGHN